MFWKLPKMWILVSASTMRVLVAFSIVYFVLPLCGLKHEAAAETEACVSVVLARVSRAAGENNPDSRHRPLRDSCQPGRDRGRDGGREVRGCKPSYVAEDARGARTEAEGTIDATMLSRLCLALLPCCLHGMFCCCCHCCGSNCKTCHASSIAGANQFTSSLLLLRFKHPLPSTHVQRQWWLHTRGPPPLPHPTPPEAPPVCSNAFCVPKGESHNSLITDCSSVNKGSVNEQRSAPLAL